MSEYMSIHRDGQRAKWGKPSTELDDVNLEDSIPKNHVDVGSTFLTERPDFTSGRHVIDENLDMLSASRTPDIHIKNSAFLPEKR